MNRLLFAVLFLMMPVLGNGATYYVAKTGSNNNSCAQAQSTSTAKLTVAAGLTCLSPGDTLIVKAGTYYERLRPTRSGTSGARITITGERGAAGEYLTIVNGSDVLAGWVAAPEVGTGVYKATKPTWAGPITGLTNEPCSMTADGLAIWHISWWWADGGLVSEFGKDALEVLGTPGSDAFWDGVEALFANEGSLTYVRFSDNSNPNSKTMRVMPWSYRCFEAPNEPDFGVFTLDETDYNTIQNFELAGGPGVVVNGAAVGNIIENSKIHDSSYYSVHLNGASGTIVRNNTIYANMIGNSVIPQGSWSGQGGKLGNLYNVNKYLVGSLLSSATMGVAATGSSGTQVTGNEIYNLPVGVYLYDGEDDWTVSGNAIHNCSSLAVYFELVDGTNTIANNLTYDCNGSFRGNRMETLPSTAKIYIYGNRTYQPSALGYGIYFSMAAPGDTTSAHIYIYNNTHIGGFAANSFGQAANQTFPNLLAVNNLIQMRDSAGQPYDDSSYTNTLCRASNGIARWDYNWTYGAAPGCTWVGSNNVQANAKIFDDSVLLVDWTPTGPAVESGIDIAQTFVVNGRSYSPLPGFSPGYFRSAPILGAPPTGPISPPPTGPISPPTNLRVTSQN